MSDDKPNITVIRRIKKVKKHGHHGGSWKIAYADFVTAMMAFFMLMWLLSLMNKYQLEGIAEYFKKPLKDAFQHQGDKNGRDVNTDKEKEKEKYKEKPNKIDAHPDKSKKEAGVGEIKSPLAKSQFGNDLHALQKDLQQKFDQHPELKQYKNQLNFIVTADGLKIELKDLENKSMFSTGKADFSNYSKPIMDWISDELNNYPNQVVVIGHTDSAQYDNENYSNWELSTDRANATRRVLIKNGMNSNKIIRIIGVADTKLLDKKNTLNPVNRRIEIIVLTDEARKKLEQQ